MEISVYLCSLTCAAPTLIYTYRHTLSLHDALPYFAGKQWFEPALLVLVAAVLPQHFHVAGIGRIAIEDFRRQEALAHLLGQWRVFDMGEAGAMLRVRQEQIPQAGIARLRLQHLDLRRHLPLRPVPATVRRHLLAQQGLFDRLDMVVHESTDALDQILCARAVGKVHRGVSWAVRQILHRHCEEIGRATSELQSLMRPSYAVFCLKKKNNTN